MLYFWVLFGGIVRIGRQLLLLFILAGCSLSQTIPPTYFGLHINRQSTPWPQVRFGSLRLWDAGSAQWSQVNPAPGKYDFSDLDEWLQKAKTHNVTDVLYTLSRTPRWAVGSSNRGDANDSSCDYNRVNGPGQCWPPKDLGPDGKGPNQIWKDWVREVATHVKNLDSSHAKIRYWQIWNEFHRDGSWKGTDDQLVRLAEDARCVITGNGTVRGQPCAEKAIDPDAMIVSPSTGTAPRALAMLKRFLDAGGSKAVDVIAIHPLCPIWIVLRKCRIGQ